MGGRDHSCEVCGRGGFNDPERFGLGCESWRRRMGARSAEQAMESALSPRGSSGMKALAGPVLDHLTSQGFLVVPKDQVPTPEEAEAVLANLEALRPILGEPADLLATGMAKLRSIAAQGDDRGR